MAFCVQCGNQLDSDSKFCSNCGMPVPVSETAKIFDPVREERKIEFEGNLRKCPNCGNLVKAFNVSCEFCGHEFRNASNSSKIVEFESRYQSAKSNAQRTVLVQSLAVPNTKEDVLEMFYLAAASVAKSDKAGKKLDEAWQAKFEQSYMKAGIVLRDDPERERVERIYQEKKVELKKWRRRLFLEEWGLLLGLTGFVVICFLLLGLMSIFGVE